MRCLKSGNTKYFLVDKSSREYDLLVMQSQIDQYLLWDNLNLYKKLISNKEEGKSKKTIPQN